MFKSFNKNITFIYNIININYRVTYRKVFNNNRRRLENVKTTKKIIFCMQECAWNFQNNHNICLSEIENNNGEKMKIRNFFIFIVM